MQDETQETIEPVATIASNGGLWMADKPAIKFKPWDGEQEEQLAELLHSKRSEIEGGKVGKRASLILQHMCAQIAGNTLWSEQADGSWQAEMPLEKREAILSQMWHVDVLVAFIMLKIETSIDRMVRFPIYSPYDLEGQRTCDWEGDLSQLPFQGSKSISDQIWEYKLKKPFKLRGKLITKLVMGPMKWAVTENLELLNPGAANLRTLAACIWEVPEFAPIGENGQRVPYTSNDLKRMHKSDISEITAGIEKNYHGLDSSIEVWDPKVKKFFKSSVPWIRADFFDVASQ